jgi:hypothetical protein
LPGRVVSCLEGGGYMNYGSGGSGVPMTQLYDPRQKESPGVGAAGQNCMHCVRDIVLNYSFHSFDGHC